jgi:hypothetical protein
MHDTILGKKRGKEVVDSSDQQLKDCVGDPDLYYAVRKTTEIWRRRRQAKRKLVGDILQGTGSKPPRLYT